MLFAISGAETAMPAMVAVIAATYQVWGALWLCVCVRFGKALWLTRDHRARPMKTVRRQSWNLKYHVAINALSSGLSAFFLTKFDAAWLNPQGFFLVMLTVLLSIYSAIGHLTTGCIDPRLVWLRCIGFGAAYIVLYVAISAAQLGT